MAAKTQDMREEFFLEEGAVFLDCASQAPLPRVSARAIQEALEWNKHPQVLTHERYAEVPARARAAIARLINAEPAEIALTSGASDGINAVAQGLAWQPGDEIVLPANEFPANYFPWRWLERQGVRVVEVAPRNRFVTEDELLAAVTPRTRLVTLSLVNYATALRLDPAGVAAACRQRAIHLLVDASQAAGAIPIDVKQLGVSFLVAAGYKWLLSPYGTGFFYVRQDLIEQLELKRIYWQAIEGAMDFNRLPRGEPRLVPDARRWDATETANFLNVAALAASVEFLLAVGVERIEGHATALTRYLVAHLAHDRCVLRSPAEAHRRGTFVAVAARTPEATAALWQKLRERKIYVAHRQDALRIAPHLFNTEREMDALLAILGE